MQWLTEVEKNNNNDEYNEEDGFDYDASKLFYYLEENMIHL